jgi:hypothetical protein
VIVVPTVVYVYLGLGFLDMILMLIARRMRGHKLYLSSKRFGEKPIGMRHS